MDNLQFMTAAEAAEYLNQTENVLTDVDIKGALINALERIDRLERDLTRSRALQKARPHA